MSTSNEYAILSSHVYWGIGANNIKNRVGVSDNIKNLHKAQNDPQTGFSYGIFSRDNDIVISFTGTDDLKDWGNDVIGAATQPENLAEYTSAAAQIKQAAQVLIDTRIRYPQAQITLTGHSLGGGIASVLAVLFDVKAEVFDPAPFRASLTDAPKVQDLISSLQNLDNPAAESYRVHLTDYLQALEAVQNKNHFAELAALENANIRGDFMRGEFLQVLRGKNTGIAVDNLNEIDIGAQDISGVGLHSMSLLLNPIENNFQAA